MNDGGLESSREANGVGLDIFDLKRLFTGKQCRISGKLRLSKIRGCCISMTIS